MDAEFQQDMGWIPTRLDMLCEQIWWGLLPPSHKGTDIKDSTIPHFSVSIYGSCMM